MSWPPNIELEFVRAEEVSRIRNIFADRCRRVLSSDPPRCGLTRWFLSVIAFGDEAAQIFTLNPFSQWTTTADSGVPPSDEFGLVGEILDDLPRRMPRNPEALSSWAYDVHAYMIKHAEALDSVPKTKECLDMLAQEICDHDPENWDRRKVRRLVELKRGPMDHLRGREVRDVIGQTRADIREATRLLANWLARGGQRNNDWEVTCGITQRSLNKSSLIDVHAANRSNPRMRHSQVIEVGRFVGVLANQIRKWAGRETRGTEFVMSDLHKRHPVMRIDERRSAGEADEMVWAWAFGCISKEMDDLKDLCQDEAVLSYDFWNNFKARLWCMLCRYSALFEEGEKGFELSISRSSFLDLKNMAEKLDNVALVEAFSTPYASNFVHYHSVFADLDANFGSKGSFFDTVIPTPALVEINPPFCEAVMRRLATKLQEELSAGNGTITCVIFLPDWVSEEKPTAVMDILQSKFLVAHRSVDVEYMAANFDCDFSLVKRMPFHSNCILLSNCTDDKIENIKRCFLSLFP